jgi:hypothetical protein
MHTSDNRGSQPECDEQLLEEMRSTPMFQPPDMWASGSARHLSPLQFFAATNEPRADLDGLDIDGFGLTEERCTTVEKQGVRVLNRWYSSPELLPYMTGDKKVPQRRLHIRYDRALAARGVLRTVEFVERNQQDVTVKRFVLHLHRAPLPELSSDDLTRARNVHLSILLKRRGDAQAEVVAMAGLDLADKLMNEVKARARRQRRNGGPPTPAAPIVAPMGVEQDQLADALEVATANLSETIDERSQEPALGAPAQSSTVQSPVDDAPVLGGEDEGFGIADAVTDPARHTADETSPLDEALGGSMGFLDD